MKIKSILTPLFALVLSATGQYAINWWTTDAGGGTSTNGQFAIQGTIGQADAHDPSLTGGEYEISGGFWGIFAVQSAGAPWLTISHTESDQVKLSWDTNTVGWILQECGNLTPTPGWTDSPSGSTNPINIPTGTTNKFYRLIKP